MLKIFAVLAILFSSDSSKAEAEFICTMFHAKSLIKIAKENSGFDLNRHCVVSCGLAVKCSPQESLSAGYAKEFFDLLGFGEPSQADLHANRVGISIACSGEASSVTGCVSACNKIFYKN